MKTVNSSVNIKKSSEVESAHCRTTQVKDSNEVNDVLIRTEIEIEMEKEKENKEGKKVETKYDNNEITADNNANLFHRKIIKILPDNNGIVYGIEASVQGAHF